MDVMGEQMHICIRVTHMAIQAAKQAPALCTQHHAVAMLAAKCLILQTSSRSCAQNPRQATEPRGPAAPTAAKAALCEPAPCSLD